MASNNTSLSSDCPDFSNQIIDVALSSLFIAMFPVALLLNGVAAWVSLHLKSTSTFIVYLKNLVAADLFMTLIFPLLAASRLQRGRVDFKVLSCRYSDVLFYCCLYTSMSLMGLISVDRFFKIVRPRGRLLGQNLMFGYVMSSFVWLVMFGGTAIPNMVLTDQQPGNITKIVCMSLKGQSGQSVHKAIVILMEVIFWLVCTTVVICYICITNKVLQSFRNSGSSNSQGKKKMKLRVFSVLIMFFVSYVPFHMIRIPFTFSELREDYVCTQFWMKICNEVTLWLSTTNVCLDPLLYIYLCREYKEKLVDMLRVSGICTQLQPTKKEETSH